MKYLILPCFLITGLLQAADPEPMKVIEEFDRPLEISYLSWSRQAAIVDGSVVVRNVNNRGGAGYVVKWNLTDSKDLSPVLRIKVGAKNQTAAIVLMLKDDKDRSGRWEFPLKDVRAGAAEFTYVFPREGAGLGDPNATDQSGKPDLAAIRQLHLMGDWLGPKDMDVEVDAVWLVKPTPEVLAIRAENEKKRLAQEDAAKKQRLALIARYSSRTENSPTVEHVSAVAPDVLAIEIQSGRLIKGGLVKYEPQPDDKRTEKKTANGEIESVIVERDGKQLGWLVGPNREWLTLWESVEGDPLLEFVGDEASTFHVQSIDDAAFAQPVIPLAVHRKSRANGWAQGPASLTHRHTYYLKLPAKLTSGKTYTVDLGELNTRDAKVTLAFVPSQVRCEAVHVNQIGYRPDDPTKRAFVSCWLGTGGRLELPPTFRFVLVAAVGARLARLLQPYDAKRADGIRASAIRAFEFAEKDHAADSAAGLTQKRGDEWKHIDFRNLAALELYQLTHDAQFHTIFLEDFVLKDERPVLHTYRKHIQEEHAFFYARLPQDLGDAALKKKAVAAMRELAEITLENASKNAFNITMPDRTKPQFIGYYTTPDASGLVFAHVLTGEARYLAGIVQATQFQSGCNPNNWVYTTGLGANPIKNAFKLDARFTGQEIPAGLTPYGNVDFAKWNQQYITWPVTYVIGKTMLPNAYAWPVTEAYWDLGGWPMLEQFTVDHWADNILVWGYLAERPLETHQR